MSNTTVETTPQTKGPVAISPQLLNEAQEALSIAITLLISDTQRTGEAMMFYGHFIQRMNVSFSNRLPTAGVSITDRVNMVINPEFFMKLTPLERQELLKHEVDHIVYLHPIRSKDYIGEGLNSNTHKLYNIAADAYINQDLPNLTANLGVTYDRLNEELKKMKSKDRVTGADGTEVTYEILKRNQIVDDNGYGEIDDHSTWDESTPNAEVAKAMITDAANKAAQATGAGNMPSSILKQIADLNKSKVNWKKELRRSCVNALKYRFERTRNRRNRRTGLLNPGRRKYPEIDVYVIGDESGSMCDESVKQVYSEIDAISKEGYRVLYSAMDAEASEPVEYNKRKPLQRTRCGGTVYGTGLEMAKKYKPNLIIVIGDMDAADVPVDPKIPVVWVVIGQQKPPGNFGKAIYVDIERN